jgi:hypothetical protein
MCSASRCRSTTAISETISHIEATNSKKQGSISSQELKQELHCYNIATSIGMYGFNLRLILVLLF